MNRHIWRRRVALFLTAVMMAGFGFTSVASADTITNTGPYSRNTIKTDIDNKCTVKNDNDVTVNNRNWQDGTTGDATVADNTSGDSWEGWDALNPQTAMAGGISHDAWWNSVVGWMAQRGTGDGWSSAGDNPSWTPSGDGWSAYDPMAWQAGGQTFGNWWNGVQQYLDGHNSAWLLGWPADATSSGGFGGDAATGSVINRNNSNFTITVNNAASVKAGVDACGKKKFTPPSVTPPQCPCPPSVTPGQPGITAPSMISPSGGAGGAGAGAGKGIGEAKVSGKGAGVPMNVPQAPSGGQGGANVPPPPCPCMCPCPPQPPKEQEKAVISNTGPGSNNSISTEVHNETTIKNTNNVTVNNSNWQDGTTGDATVTDNTRAGDATSGDAYNTNKTQADVEINN